jgi:hypothetical protein
MTEELVRITCCGCAVSFGMTSAMYTLREKDYAEFCCPNGHRQGFTKPEDTDPKDTELATLRDKVASLTKSVERLTTENATLTAALTALATELEIWKPRDTELKDTGAAPKTDAAGAKS